VDVNDIEKIRALPEPTRTEVLESLAGALDDVFLAGVPIVLVALVCAFFLPQVTLTGRHDAPPPTGTDAVQVAAAPAPGPAG
jgi:hypothetical protein